MIKNYRNSFISGVVITSTHLLLAKLNKRKKQKKLEQDNAVMEKFLRELSTLESFIDLL